MENFRLQSGRCKKGDKTRQPPFTRDYISESSKNCIEDAIEERASGTRH
jgi:hypothetical protein